MMKYLLYLLIIINIQTIKGKISTETVFQENQLDDECGIFSGSVHQNHNTNSESGAVTVEQEENEDHLDLDPKITSINWPWQAFIKIDGKYKCNGILIKKDWVLTTASCVDDETLKLEVEINNETIQILSVFQHNGFKEDIPKKLAGDIALVKLVKPIPIKSTGGISPICLPRSKAQMRQTTECAVSYMSPENTTIEGKKTKLKINTTTAAGKIINKLHCSKHGMQIEGVNEDLLLCIGTPREMRTSCKNPPIMFFSCKSSGFWSIYGMSKLCSITKNTDHDHSFAFHLQILSYLGWIKRTIEKKDGKIVIKN